MAKKVEEIDILKSVLLHESYLAKLNNLIKPYPSQMKAHTLTNEKIRAKNDQLEEKKSIRHMNKMQQTDEIKWEDIFDLLELIRSVSIEIVEKISFLQIQKRSNGIHSMKNSFKADIYRKAEDKGHKRKRKDDRYQFMYNKVNYLLKMIIWTKT